MAGSKIAYCVTKGSYSDYRVICVCDSKERAETVVTALLADPEASRWDEPCVEKMQLVDYDPVKIPMYHMQVIVWDDGSTEEKEPRESSEWPFDSWQPLVRVSWFWVRAPIYKGDGGRLEVHGTNLEAVRHVFSDRRAQLIADRTFRSRVEAKG